MIRALEAMKSKKAPPPRDSIAPDRLRLLLDDMTALIVVLHARDTVKELPRAEGLPPEARQWMEGELSRLQGCAPGRFEGRGGEAAYGQSLALAERYRAKLEPLILELGRWRPGTATRAAAPKSGKP